MKITQRKLSILIALIYAIPMFCLGLWRPGWWVWAFVGMAAGALSGYYGVPRLNAIVAASVTGVRVHQRGTILTHLGIVAFLAALEGLLLFTWRVYPSGLSRFDKGLFSYAPAVVIGQGFTLTLLASLAARKRPLQGR